MKTTILLISFICFLFFLSSCGSANRNSSCYSVANGNSKKTQILRWGTAKKKTKKKKSTEGQRDNRIDSRMVRIENGIPTAGQTAPNQVKPNYLKPVPDYTIVSTDDFIVARVRNNSIIESVKLKKRRTKDLSSNEGTRKGVLHESIVLGRRKSDKAEPKPSKLEKNRKIDGKFAFGSGLVALLMAGFFRLNIRRVKRVSSWARKNSRLSIVAITTIKIFLIFGGLFIGKELAENNLALSDTTRNISLSVYLFAALFYPISGSLSRFFRSTFQRRKLHDLALPFAGLLLMICLGNKSSIDIEFSAPINFTFQKFESGFGDANGDYDYKLTHIDGNEQHQYMEDSKFTTNNKPERSKGEKLLLTVLAIIVFLVLLSLLSSLACSLSCSGQEALAIIVGVGGGIGLIVLLVVVLRKIYRPV